MTMSKVSQVELDINIGRCYRSYQYSPTVLLKRTIVVSVVFVKSGRAKITQEELSKCKGCGGCG